ncbi:hypothetical protein ES703_59732 [subsurface metagenome]
MRKGKVTLTVTVLDADIKLTFLFIGFLGQLGYFPINERTRAKPGKISVVYERKEEK